MVATLDPVLHTQQDSRGIEWLVMYCAAENTTSEPYRLYNLDVFEYTADSPFGLYGSIPIMWAHRLGATVGAFW